MIPVVATIVEGDGEVLALPVLLRRLQPMCQYPRPIRVKRNRILKEGELERYVNMARASIAESGGTGAVLVLLDADDDCPATLGPELRRRVDAIVGERWCSVVLAKREYEAWLFGGGVANSDAAPETIVSPKESLKEALGRYRPTADQASLSSKMDLQLAETRCPSFAKLVREINRLSEVLNISAEIDRMSAGK